jgi:phosphoenolpyruvate phosphomutase
MKVNKKFRSLLNSHKTEFLMEAHNAISGKIVEQAGFKGIWASGLSISASLGYRDTNEISYSQILDIVEYISDVTTIPIILDADTGYGNFNNARILIKKLEQKKIAAVCIEDKLFPKMNSFCNSERQPLADIEEFCGKIKAMKDTQSDPNFSVIARTESFIIGKGIKEALKRASAYRQAGADAILVHSKNETADEIIEFVNNWDKFYPIIIIPTTYYKTPVKLYNELGIRIVIWSNHMIRASVYYMQKIAKTVRQMNTVSSIENEIATIDELFRLQNLEELINAEKIYLPKS